MNSKLHWEVRASRLLVGLIWLAGLSISSVRAQNWTYPRQDLWGDSFPTCAPSNTRQSPIDIVTKDVISDPNYKLEFSNYEAPIEFVVKTTRHSINLSPVNMNAVPNVKPNWLDNKIYELQGIHFHWGENLGSGSEHTVDGVRRLAEVRTHVRSKQLYISQY